MLSWALRLVALATILGWPALAQAQPWCRIDDPAAFIAARARLPAEKQGNVDAVVCSPTSDAQTIPEELALPLPCGRFMLFRRVTVPMSHALDQQVGYFGRDRPAGDEDNPLEQIQEGPWTGHVAGSFTIPKTGGGQRAYYIGKYPVAAHQARLAELGLMVPDGGRLTAQDPACKAYNESLTPLRERSVVPATGVSWFDAVAFGRTYMEWLLSVDGARRARNQPPFLPWERSSSGFLRLPTEAEWEFAARGGEASAERQNQPFYRVRDPADGQVREARSKEEIAQTSSRDGRPVGVGGKAPNLLGLYDMVGNQWQIVFDMFRPVRPDATFQADPGGFVVRGGSVRGTTGIADRKERENYVEGKLNRGDPTVGFRLVLAAPVVVNDGDWRQQMASSAGVEAELRNGRKALLSATALADAAPRRSLEADLSALSRANTDLAAATKRAEGEAERARALEQEVLKARSKIAELDQTAAGVAQSRSEVAEARRNQEAAARNLAVLEQQSRDQAERIREQQRQMDVRLAQTVEVTQARVRDMQQSLERSTAALNQTEAELADELVFTATTLARNIDNLGQVNWLSQRTYLPLFAKMRGSRDPSFSPPDVQRSIEDIRGFISQNTLTVESRLIDTFSRYLSTVLRIARFPRATINTAFARADIQMKTPQGQSSETLLLVMKHVLEAADSGAIVRPNARQAWLNDIDSTRSRRTTP